MFNNFIIRLSSNFPLLYRTLAISYLFLFVLLTYLDGLHGQ